MSETVTMRSRRTIRLPDPTPPYSALWGYGYAELAQLLGISQSAVRQRVHRKTLDPSFWGLVALVRNMPCGADCCCSVCVAGMEE